MSGGETVDVKALPLYDRPTMSQPGSEMVRGGGQSAAVSHQKFVGDF